MKALIFLYSFLYVALSGSTPPPAGDNNAPLKAVSIPLWRSQDQVYFKKRQTVPQILRPAEDGTVYYANGIAFFMSC